MNGSPPRILVTDAGRGSAVAVIRSLGRLGWHVVAAASDPRAAGFRSRHAAARIRYPDPLADREAMVEHLVETCRERQIDLIVPVTEEVALPVSRARSRFEPRTRVALAEPASFERARDKDQVLELAREVGIPVPRTRTVTAGTADSADPMLGWPVVVKPAVSRDSDGDQTLVHEVAYAGNAGALASILAALPATTTVLLQELCPGAGIGVELVTDRGRVIEAFQHRRLREVPTTGGASSYRESMALDPGLFEHATALLSALRWTGVAMVEFKVGPDGPRLMEVNPRLWGSLPLALAAGVDIPQRMARLHLGHPQPEGPTPYRAGVRARNLTLDLHWAGVVALGRGRRQVGPRLPRRAALGVLANVVRHPTESDLFAADDLGPQLVEIARLPERLGKLTRSRRR